MQEPTEQESQRTTRRRVLVGIGGVGVTAIAGCVRASDCPGSKLVEASDDSLLASISTKGYISEIELTVNFWRPAGTQENPATQAVLFDARGESMGEFDVPAGVRSTTSKVEKPETETAYIRLYSAAVEVLGTWQAEVQC